MSITSAIADERTYIDDGYTDTDDVCTFIADVGTFPLRDVKNPMLA